MDQIGYCVEPDWIFLLGLAELFKALKYNQLIPSPTPIIVKIPTKPQHNGWVLHENDFANPTTHPTTETQ